MIMLLVHIDWRTGGSTILQAASIVPTERAASATHWINEETGNFLSAPPSAAIDCPCNASRSGERRIDAPGSCQPFFEDCLLDIGLLLESEKVGA